MTRKSNGFGRHLQEVQQSRKISDAVGSGTAAHNRSFVVGAVVIVALGTIEKSLRSMQGTKVEQQVFADPEAVIKA